MKFQFLGTAAAEGIPSMFCDCEVCRISRERGGRHLRSRAQAVVDGKLLIDFGPDTYFHFTRFGLNLTDIENCLITHSHFDHLSTLELAVLQEWGAHPREGYRFNLFGSRDLECIKPEFIEKLGGKLSVNIIPPFVPTKIGKYTVTALNAWHGTTEPFIYLISDGEKTVLYANDTDSLPEASMDYLKKTRPIIDLVAADCTAGNSPEIMYRAHMGMIQNRELRGALIELGCITADTPYYLNHFSHNGYDVLYDEFCEIVEKEGFKVAFDGLEIEL